MQLPFSSSALEPAGPQAQAVDGLFSAMLVTAVFIYLLVMTALFLAAVRRRRTATPAPADAGGERGPTLAVAAGMAATVVVLFVLLVVDFRVARRLGGPAASSRALTVEITAHQWWWEIHYLDSVPQRRITTANELYLPVGQPVRLVMQSADVIHSFWVPMLAGKKDLVPGYRSELWIQADRAGLYRGQCAEFCGHQHAKMGVTVIAVTPDEFAAWAEAQRAAGHPPGDSTTRRGQQVFLQRSCALCHNITGTTASATVGPDLTHLASRRTLAAGTRPNTRGHLAGWILDPHGIKPGVRMPANALEPNELHALLAYLESLK